MKVSRLTIENFRGIKHATLYLPDHAVLIGDNNVGKTTVFEALDLALGPDRLNRRPVVDEHDFYQGKYLALPKAENMESATASEPATPEATSGSAATDAAAATTAAATGEALTQQIQPPIPANDDGAPKIMIEATVTKLSDEQRARFKNHIEWWDNKTDEFYEVANPEGVDASNIVEALRVTFIGEYDMETDDFEGNTYYTRSIQEDSAPDFFTKKDKQLCGFLYLRSLRTGSRALSLDHGSLLDIILRIKEIRPQMWEQTIADVSAFNVAEDEKLGISGILKSINASLKKFVPREWGINPHLKVSALTRDHLRKVVTAFIATGEGEHAAPFFRQGTGTINMLVLAMLSQIAEGKQNVIFAMEEPETAIPPYAQKRIVHEVLKLAAQSLFTSHSPYVLEEFKLEQTVILSRDEDGTLTQHNVQLPASVKHKAYRQDFRTRFCEGLLSRRVIIMEGLTEATAFPAAARRLHELAPDKYTSLEGLGIAIVDAGSDSRVADVGKLYRDLGKTVYACCDMQEATAKAAIEAQVDKLYMHGEKGIEKLVLKNTTAAALDRFCKSLAWPPHLVAKYPKPETDAVNALSEYFGWSKGNWGIADFLAQCNEAEIPAFIKDACIDLKVLCEPEDGDSATTRPPDPVAAVA